jgi:CubicO group peptidase (beta-lactamase class C family)
MTNAQAPRGRLADLTEVVPRQLVDDRRSGFEDYVSTAITKFGVPGAAVAVIQGGEVAYLSGFGIKELGGAEPVTPDTRLMIGSITKPMTTMLAAALIDDGRLNWDTRLVDLLPQFDAGDRSLTQRLTVRDAFCNCSGLPGRDLERYFERGKLTPEAALTALAGVTPVAPFGEQFLYNNLLVASGGYAAGVAARGGAARGVGLTYDAALQERVLSPLGMTRSTFDLAAVRADGDYASPHAADLSGDLRPIPLASRTYWPQCGQPVACGRPRGKWRFSCKPSWPAALPERQARGLRGESGSDLGAWGGGSKSLRRSAGDGRGNVALRARLAKRQIPGCASNQPCRRHYRLHRPGRVPPR